jgi:polyphosphate glucokinase
MLLFGTGIDSAIFCDGVLLPNTEFGYLRIRGNPAVHRASEQAREEKGFFMKMEHSCKRIPL